MTHRRGHVKPTLVWALTVFVAVQTAAISLPETGRQIDAQLATPALNSRILTVGADGCSTVSFPRWRNPVLEVSAAGIKVKAASVKSPDIVKAQSLHGVLTSLPLTDWPRGRIVVIAGPSIGPGDDEWWRAVDQNLAWAVEVAKALGVVPCIAAS